MSLDGTERDAVVIGAGMVGVCCAWHLQKRGFRVTVVDRKTPGEETSWGNAGLIQRECVLPCGFPQSFKERFEIALNIRDSSCYNPAALVKYWYAVCDYWRNSLPSNYDRVARQFATLIEHCLTEHEVLIKASRSEKMIRKGGFIEAFRTKSMADIEALAEDMRSRGVTVDAMSPADIKEAEPSVDPSCFSGAVNFCGAWRATNPDALVKAYANNFVSMGGTLVQATVQSVSPPSASNEGRWVVHTDGGDISAPHVVVAAGPWSADLLRPLGIHIPLYPLRGYNTHFATLDGAPKLSTALIAMDNGVGISPMEMGVRLTTGGELANRDAGPNLDQLENAVAVAKRFLPLAEQLTGVWLGSRPMLPDLKPIIGPAPHHPGLFLNLGHGGNGLTLSAVSGRLLAELLSGDVPSVDPSPFAASRFT